MAGDDDPFSERTTKGEVEVRLQRLGYQETGY